MSLFKMIGFKYILFLQQMPHPAGITVVKFLVCVPVQATVRTPEIAAMIIMVRKIV